MSTHLDWRRVSPRQPQRSVSVQVDADLHTAIYHYIRPEHLASAVRERKLWMRNVEGWDDPVESIWGKEVFGAVNESRSHTHKKQAFGHCWSLDGVNESMWRLHTDRCTHKDANGEPYPPSLPPVRIQSTPQKLVDGFLRVIADHRGKAFTGRVSYKGDQELADVVAAVRGMHEDDKVAAVLARALHAKRLEYSKEQEWRVLWIETGAVGAHRELPFDTVGLLDGVVVGPTKDHVRRQEVVDLLIESGVPPARITCSRLYETPHWGHLLSQAKPIPAGRRS